MPVDLVPLFLFLFQIAVYRYIHLILIGAEFSLFRVNLRWPLYVHVAQAFCIEECLHGQPGFVSGTSRRLSEFVIRV